MSLFNDSPTGTLFVVVASLLLTVFLKAFNLVNNLDEVRANMEADSNDKLPEEELIGQMR